MRVSIKLHGQLYWYVQKHKELEWEVQGETIQDLAYELKLPIGEISLSPWTVKGRLIPRSIGTGWLNFTPSSVGAR